MSDLDELDPTRVSRWANTGLSLALVARTEEVDDDQLVEMADYRELWKRFQARSEVGYAVEAGSLRKQLKQQREDFDKRLKELEAELCSWRTACAFYMKDAQACRAQARAAVGVVQEAIEGLVERELGRYRREIQTAELWPGNDPNFDWEHVRVPHLRSAGDAMSRVYVLREALTVLSQGEGQNGE